MSAAKKHRPKFVVHVRQVMDSTRTGHWWSCLLMKQWSWYHYFRWCFRLLTTLVLQKVFIRKGDAAATIWGGLVCKHHAKLKGMKPRKLRGIISVCWFCCQFGRIYLFVSLCGCLVFFKHPLVFAYICLHVLLYPHEELCRYAPNGLFPKEKHVWGILSLRKLS